MHELHMLSMASFSAGIPQQECQGRYDYVLAFFLQHAE